jgi:hypothetical protein
MSVNDSVLCVAAKKILGVAPGTIIDDPSKVEALVDSAYHSGDWEGGLLTPAEEQAMLDWQKKKDEAWIAEMDRMF